jgi:hypothetical protein
MGTALYRAAVQCSTTNAILQVPKARLQHCTYIMVWNSVTIVRRRAPLRRTNKVGPCFPPVSCGLVGKWQTFRLTQSAKIGSVYIQFFLVLGSTRLVSLLFPYQLQWEWIFLPQTCLGSHLIGCTRRLFVAVLSTLPESGNMGEGCCCGFRTISSYYSWKPWSSWATPASGVSMAAWGDCSLSLFSFDSALLSSNTTRHITAST